MEQRPQNLVVAWPDKEYPNFYETRRLIGVFTRSATGPYPGVEESTNNPESLFRLDPSHPRSPLVVSSLQVSRLKIVYHFSLPSPMCSLFPVHLTPLIL